MRQFQESIRPYEGIPAGLQINWEHRRQPWKHLESPGSAGDTPGSTGDMSGSTFITVEHSGKKNIILGNAAGAPGIYSYYLSFNDF